MPSLYCNQGHPNLSESRYCSICGEKLNPSGPDPQGGVLAGTAVLGHRYRIRYQLGAGGFGRTYLAADQNRFNELCVLKEFAPQVEGQAAVQKAEELFQREAGTLYHLRHPQIPRFRELLRTEFEGHLCLFLVQDYVEGQTYQHLLETRRLEGKAFTETEVVQLFHHLLPVLGYIHSQGVIHRDISPDNLILRTADQLPVLIDFGGVKQVAATIASQYTASNTSVTRLGKVGYAPKEQMQDGEVSPPSDFYALGITALVLLSGKEPSQLGDIASAGWKRQVAVSPPMMAILERMVAANPRSRFASADQLLQALPGSALQPLAPGSLTAAEMERTWAIAPAAPNSPAAQTVVPYPASTASTPSMAQPRDGAGMAAMLATLILVGGVISALWFTRDGWVPLFLGQPEVSDSPSPDTTFSAVEQTRKATIADRRKDLEVDSRFLISLTDSTFFRRYPEMQGRSLTEAAEDAPWRERWDGIALEWLDWFKANLSTPARQQLGGYNEGDRNSWKQAANQLHVSSRALNDLADARFFQAFADWRDENFIDQPIGQVWQAIAFDQLQALKSGDRLNHIRFRSGDYSQSLEQELAPGTGMVYIADLNQGQPLRLALKAPPQATLLSIYLPVPTQEQPVILEDAAETQWSGELPQSGFYEVVVVSRRDQPFHYTLNLAADQITTAPIQPEPLPSHDADLDLPIAPQQGNE